MSDGWNVRQIQKLVKQNILKLNISLTIKWK